MPMLRTTRSISKPPSYKQLPHAPLGRRKVVRVVDVPEEPALLQVVGHDDEEDAAGRSTRSASATNARAASMPDMCSSTWSA